MPSLYLTPASIAYLTQFILALAITLFLIRRLRSQRTPSLIFLTAFFAPMTVFTGLLVFNAALLPYPRILTVFAENVFLGMALVALNAFAYHFPERYPQHKWEMRVVLTLSLAYFFWEVGFMIYRYISLIGQGNVFIRPALVAYSIPIIILFAPVASLRQTIAADPRPVAWWRKLWKPQGKGAQGARKFALVFVIPVVLGIINALVFFGLPLSVIHAIISIGVLVMFWLFATNYVNFIPGNVDVASRLSILILTLFLALLGTVGWLIAPSYVATFQPDLREHQTLRFTPDASGGYNVSEVDFHFESALGEKVRAETLDENGNQRVKFTFPFYGETQTEAFVSYSGFISLGETFRPLNLQAADFRIPTIFPLVILLEPNPADEDSGLFVRREPERLIVTWNRLLPPSRPETPYTFQAILYADGVFEFNYNGLPQSILFSPNTSPSDNPWMRGAVAGHGEPLYGPPTGTQTTSDLVTLSQTGASPLLENYLFAFRRYLHTFMLPVAWVVIGGSLLILLAIPLLLSSSISRPLEALTAGVRRMGEGELNVTIPVHSEDEIGFLTRAFNNMSKEMEVLISDLESRVEERTIALTELNRSLSDSQRFFEELFEVSPDAVVTVDQKGIITQANARVEIIFGYARPELIGKPIDTLFPEKFTDLYRKGPIDSRKVSDVSAVGIEVNGKRKDGRMFPADLLFSPFKSTHGRLILVVVRDISERVNMENVLRRRNETLAALDQMMLDLANRHEVDDILQTLLGKIGPLLDAQDVSIDMVEGGDTLVTYAATPNQPLRAGDLMRRNEGGWLSWQAVDTRQPAVLVDYSTWERRRELYEGHPIHAIMIVPILQGERVEGTINFSRTTPDYPFDETDIYAATQLAQMVALALDNSHLYTQFRTELEERREIEEVLRISQKNFMSYFNMGAVGMSVTTPDQKWLEVNDRLCEMLGYSREELKQTTWTELTHPDDLDSNQELFEQALRGERDSYQLDKRFIRKDGGIVYASMYATCQRNIDRSVGYFLVSLVDITERVQQEQALRQAQAELLEQKLNSATLEERQRLARDLHDSLNQSIHSLVLFSETLVAAIEKKNLEHAKHIVEQVQESARQSLKETRLLLFELQTQGQGRSVDLIHDLEERFAKVENHAGIRSQIIQRGNLEQIPLSWHENLYWITIEALNNALKHAQANKMLIDIRCTPQEMELTITDDGRGFLPAKVVPGGMGLDNMHARARQLGGELTVESEPTKGTCVRFRAEIKAENHGKY